MKRTSSNLLRLFYVSYNKYHLCSPFVRQARILIIVSVEHFCIVNKLRAKAWWKWRGPNFSKCCGESRSSCPSGMPLWKVPLSILVEWVGPLNESTATHRWVFLFFRTLLSVFSFYVFACLHYVWYYPWIGVPKKIGVPLNIEVRLCNSLNGYVCSTSRTAKVARDNLMCCRHNYSSWWYRSKYLWEDRAA